MRVRLPLIALAVAMGATACSTDATGSPEYQDLEASLATAQVELAGTRARLAEVTAERDALADAARANQASPTDIDEACAEMAATRHSRSRATQERIIEIVADPSAFGTEDAVLDLLDQVAAPGAMFGDDAFGGAVPWRTGWRNTLFGERDATIRTWLRWLSDDGSTGGALWTWSGTGPGGGHFDLIGISLNTYDEDGRVTSQTAYYPYESSYVMETFTAAGG
jgi:hypothetical protein